MNSISKLDFVLKNFIKDKPSFFFLIIQIGMRILKEELFLDLLIKFKRFSFKYLN